MFPIELLGVRTNPAKSARNFGVIFDKNFAFRSHISVVGNSCFYHMRDLRRIRCHLDLDSAKLLATALASSRLDYCNSLLYGIADIVILICVWYSWVTDRLVWFISRFGFIRFEHPLTFSSLFLLYHFSTLWGPAVSQIVHLMPEISPKYCCRLNVAHCWWWGRFSPVAKAWDCHSEKVGSFPGLCLSQVLHLWTEM